MGGWGTTGLLFLIAKHQIFPSSRFGGEESTPCTSQTKSHTLPPGFGKAEGVTSGWPPEPAVETATEHAVPSTRASLLQSRT